MKDINVITNVDQITAEWLTTALTRSGALTRGAVQSFEFDTGQGNWSTSANLKVTYTDAAQGALSGRLFLKMVDTDLGNGEFFGDSEVTYYTRDYVDVKNAPLIRCYDAAYSQELNRYHLLLDDISETHIEAYDKKTDTRIWSCACRGIGDSPCPLVGKGSVGRSRCDWA